jgi:antibiotic biosynthesis monooxygenase (ABM) superfamily enzyme
MKKYKAIIYILIAVVIVGVLMYFVYIPQIKTVVMLWAQNSIKRGEIQTLEKKKAALPELKKEEAEE